MKTTVGAGLSCAIVLAWAGGCAEPTTLLDEMIAESDVAGDLVERGRRVQYVDNTLDLQEHIGDEHTVIILATTSTDEGGNYVIPKCATRAEEGVNPYCGQMTLGYGSSLIGGLIPEMDGPDPTGNIERPGPFIDCSAATNPREEWDPDDGNGWKLSCLEMTAGIVWGVQIDNGEVDRQLPGQGSHRNAILVQANDGLTVVGRSFLTDARRGVLHGSDTDVTVWQTVISDVELGGVFSLNGDLDSDSPPKRVDGSVMNADVSSVRFESIGNWSMLFLWAIGGDSNESNAAYSDVFVDATALRGLLVYGNNGLDPDPVTNSTGRFEMHDARLEPEATGVLMTWFGEADNVDNTVIGELSDVTFANASGIPVQATYDPWPGSRMILAMNGDTYVGASAGAITSQCLTNVIPAGCGDAEEPRWRLAGTAAEFAVANDNFDISSLTDDHFTGEALP